MPTKFLEDRYHTFSQELSDKDTVQYISFDSGSRDDLTGDVDESSAYGGQEVDLHARVDLQPSKVMRELAGAGVEFYSVIRLTNKELDKHKLDIKIGDAFILSGDTRKSYVIKIIRGKQVGKIYIETMVFLTRKTRSRG